VDLLAASHPTLGALQRPSALWSGLALACPVLALLAGIATDRIGNPYRVDLLSAPLLIIIGFNLLSYATLAVLAVRRKPGARPSWLPSLLQQIDGWRSRQRGTAARVTAGFYQLWHLVAGHILVGRWKTVLHVSAAAWGAGVALSLAGRGLFVQYKVGWESTFLSAETVHGLPTRVFHLTPLTLDEVTALRNFQNDSVAGERWVWMYVGLTALLVILPRLLLAAWSAGRARAASRRLRLDLSAPYFQAVLASMRRVRLTIGLACADAASHAQFVSLARLLADDPLAQPLAISTPEGDWLQWLEHADSDSPVDCVVTTDTGEPPGMPSAWSGRPLVFVTGSKLAHSWPQWPVLTRALAITMASETHAGWQRLETRLQQAQQQRLERSMAAVAACLSRVAVHIHGDSPVDAIETALEELFLTLQHIHGLDHASGRALTVLPAKYGAAPPVMGRKSVTAASAATGAGMGAAVDASTGFLTLGAGTALGALLGAGIGWVSALRLKKGADADTLQRLTEATLLLYLQVADSVRVQAASGSLSGTWPPEIARQVQQRKGGLAGLWSVRDSALQERVGAGAVPLLVETVQAVVDTLYPATAPVDSAGPAATP
jgi:hypothetical protein